MKILLIAENTFDFVYGGVERHCHNIKLLFSSSNVQILSVSKEDILHYKLKWIDKTIFSEKDLKRVINESRCEIIHIHGFASFVAYQSIKIALKLQKKIIYTAHFHPFKTLDNPFLGRSFFYVFLRPLLSKIDTIVTINKEDTSFFLKYNPNVIMIPNWLSAEVRYNNLTKKKNMILFVGRNESNKSIDYLLALPPKKYEIHCVTNSKKELRNDFIIHQRVSDIELIELYSQASLLVIPSRYEAFSYVALEALMHSTPILVSDRVRIIDYVQGINGVVVFTYGNKHEFLSLIDYAIQQKVDIKKIMEIFNPQQIKDQLLNIYLKAFDKL